MSKASRNKHARYSSQPSDQPVAPCAKAMKSNETTSLTEPLRADFAELHGTGIMRMIQVDDLGATKEGIPNLRFVSADAVGNEYIMHSDQNAALWFNFPPFDLVGKLVGFFVIGTPDARLLARHWWEPEPEDAEPFYAQERAHQEAKAIAAAIPPKGKPEALDKRRRL